MSKKQNKFIVIDGNAIMHRAWHALPPLQTKKGELINAAYGFTMILLRVLKDLKPDYAAVTFDLKGPTFRHREYKDYKAKRVKQPDELYNQMPKIKQIVRAFNLPIFEKEGYEADDLIGTIVKKIQGAKPPLQIIIVTGDLDTLQLVNQNTKVYTMHKGISDSIIYDSEEIKKRFDGLVPEQMVDYRALKGDASDNIPGVRGIGEKTAINLIKEFHTLENVYQNLNSSKIKERYQKLLKEHKKDAALSKKLSTIDTDVKIDFDLKNCEIKGYNPDLVIPLFQELEFRTLLTRLPKEMQNAKQSSFFFEATAGKKIKKDPEAKYILVDNNEKFEKFEKSLKQQKDFTIDTETTGLDPFNSNLVGISFCWQNKLAYFLPAKKEYLLKIKKIIEDEKIEKSGHNLKFDIQALDSAGIKINGGFFDTMIASYLINPGSRQHGLDNLVFTELGHQMQPITDLIGKGKNQISLAQVDINKVSDYSCEDADYTHRLISPLTKQLEEKNNLGLLKKIEMPLVPVLAEMEKIGVKIDIGFLNKMAVNISKELVALENKIYKLANANFNINSPLQLKEILFDKLKINSQNLGRTKTGISTAAGEMDKLKGQHEIIPYILKYRELSKLKSTYIEALPELISIKDGRLHTSFNQTVTATGRLSSSEPNLQNIPIRTELGQQIRKAFIAEKGYKILAADYSQIELRIIASLANDKKMIAVFEKDEDIHATTAAEINEVELSAVTKSMRRAAKSVNFGIIYGMGIHGLAAQEGISYEKSRTFIEKYFLLFQDVKKYLENTKMLAGQNGFVETLFGRRRYLPEINSGVQNIKATAERMAVNHPIQGTAADIIKLAMIDIAEKLPNISMETKMILQVHDELVFEVPEKELKKTAKLIKETMENIYRLRVPIKVGLEAGDNWGNMTILN